MKMMLIQNETDFEKLRNVTGKEEIYIKISRILGFIDLKEIDLSNFYGNIEIVIEKPIGKRKIRVYTKTNKNNFVFCNVNPYTKIKIKGYCEIEYKRQEKKKYGIHKEPDFKMLPKRILPNTLLYLKNDIALAKPFSEAFQNITVDCNGYTIYTTEEIQTSWQKNRITWVNEKVKIVDCVIPLKDFDQLKDALEYPNGKVAVAINQNFENKEIPCTNLANFRGTLIVLGNCNYIQNCTLIDNFDRSLGLISTISNQANVLIKDLFLGKIHFPEVLNIINVGTLIGEKRKEQRKYQSMPGYTYFVNCHITDTYIPKTSYTSGVFIGFADDFTDLYNCFHYRISGENSHMPMGNMSYYHEENIEYTLLDPKKKKVVYENSRTLTKEN